MSHFIDILESLYALFWQDPTAQLIGFIAFFVGASAFLHKDDQKLRYYLTAFTFLMAVHFFMLDLWSTAIIALLGSARNYVSSLTNNVWVMMLFLFTTWLMAIPNSNNWVHLLPVLAVSLGTWAVFKEQGIRMRILMFLGSVSWLTHNYLVGSIGGAIIECLFIIINGRTIFKLFEEQATLR